MKLEDLLSRHAIALDVRAKGKDSALSKIAYRMGRRSGLEGGVILRALLEREHGGVTAFGAGVAIPHAFMEELQQPLASFTRLASPIDIGASDGVPVDLLLTLLWPANDVTQFLPVLANVTRVFRSERLRTGLRDASSADDVLTLLSIRPEDLPGNSDPDNTAVRRAAP